jgi:hypothetical protein
VCTSGAALHAANLTTLSTVANTSTPPCGETSYAMYRETTLRSRAQWNLCHNMAATSKRARRLCNVALLGDVPMPPTTALYEKDARGLERNNTKRLALQRSPKPYTFQRTLGRYTLRLTDMPVGLYNARPSEGNMSRHGIDPKTTNTNATIVLMA